jgi:hypothetical protein
MATNRSDHRSARTSKFDVECLGERIAPAVYQTGLLGDVHQLVVNRGSQSQFDLLVRENQQTGERLGRVEGHGTFIWSPFTFQNRLLSASIIVKGPVKPVPVTPIVPHHPVFLPFGEVFLNIVRIPVRPVPVRPIVPKTPVITPYNPAAPNAVTSANSGVLSANVSAALNAIVR